MLSDMPRIKVVHMLSACLLLWAQAVSSADDSTPAFFNLQPGKVGKAEVDLALGEPLRKLESADESYEYAPPPGAFMAQRVVVAFFPDTLRAERLDVYMKTPLPAQDLRTQFGVQLLSRVRRDGAREELFYPALQAIIFDKTKEAATAVSYLSPRMLADIYADRFNELIAAKRYKEASVEADKAVLIDPNYSRGYVAQGVYSMSQKDFDQAIARFLAAFDAEYAPRSKALGHLWLGELYAKNKNLPEKGRTEFEAALALAPDYARVHLEYGKFLLEQRSKDHASLEFARALELEPKSDDMRRAVADALYAAHEWAQALPHFQLLVKWIGEKSTLEAPLERKIDLYFRYGYCLEQAKRWDEALAAFETCASLDARQGAAYENRGWIYLQMGRLDAAETEFRKALGINPKDGYANGHLAQVLLKHGRIEEALDYARRALSVMPNAAWVMADIARCLAARGQKKWHAEDRRMAIDFLRKAGDAGLRDDGALKNDPYLRKILAADKDLRTLLQVK